MGSAKPEIPLRGGEEQECPIVSHGKRMSNLEQGISNDEVFSLVCWTVLMLATSIEMSCLFSSSKGLILVFEIRGYAPLRHSAVPCSIFDIQLV
jgi:hypothetical protein